MNNTEIPTLIDVPSLQARLTRETALGAGLRLLDLRWSPGGTSARERYEAGHIPGALLLELDRDLSDAQPRGPGGRHPMVSPQALAQTLARLGIDEETDVVIYDDGSGAFAARGWFQLRLHGHARVSLLDGGLAAWTAAGLPLETAAPSVLPAAPRALARDSSQLVDRAFIADFVSNRHEPSAAAPILLDARAPERYRGEVEPLDRIAGHIPGALNLPFARFLRSAADPRWKPAGEIREILDGLGLRGRDVVVSCGSGVTACHLLAAFALADYPPPRLYTGSYSDWVSDPDAPVERTL